MGAEVLGFVGHRRGWAFANLGLGRKVEAYQDLVAGTFDAGGHLLEFPAGIHSFIHNAFEFHPMRTVRDYCARCISYFFLAA